MDWAMKSQQLGNKECIHSREKMDATLWVRTRMSQVMLKLEGSGLRSCDVSQDRLIGVAVESFNASHDLVLCRSWCVWRTHAHSKD